jgi:hypothetical protein
LPHGQIIFGAVVTALCNKRSRLSVGLNGWPLTMPIEAGTPRSSGSIAEIGS